MSTINELTRAAAVAGGDLFPIWSAGDQDTRAVTADQIAEFAGLDAAPPDDFATFADMIASDAVSLGAIGKTIWAGGFPYQVQDPLSLTAHFTTAGGVNLNAVRVMGAFSTRQFGLIDSAVTVQTDAFMKFWRAVVANRAEGVIDNGTTEFGGAVIYLNSTGLVDGGPINGIVLRGVNRRFSILQNVYIHVGAVGGFGGDGLASGTLSLSRFMVIGGMRLWSPELASSVSEVRIRPTNLILAQAAAENAALSAYGANHLHLRDVTISNETTDGTIVDVDGLFLDTCVGTIAVNVGANGVRDGIVLREGTQASSGANTGAWLIGCNVESNTRRGVYVENGFAITISGHFRGSNVGSLVWDRAYPVIQIGDAAGSENPTAITIAGAFITGIDTTAGVGIGINRAQGVSVDGCRFVDFQSGITRETTGDLVDIRPTNSFTSVTNPALAPTYSASGSTRADLPATVREPATIAEATNLLTHFGTNTQAQLTLTTALLRTFSAPSGGRIGEVYRIIVKKTNASGNVGWNAVFKFAGAAPTLSAMTTAQAWIGEFYFDGTNYLCFAQEVIG